VFTANLFANDTCVPSSTYYRAYWDLRTAAGNPSPRLTQICIIPYSATPLAVNAVCTNVGPPVILTNPANCTGNNFAKGIDATGIAECAQVMFSNLGGSATLSQLPFGTANQLLKTNVGGTALEHATLSIGTTGTDFALAFGAGTIALNLPTASATNRGALSSANWTTFDNSVDSVTGTANEITSTGGQAPVLSIASAFNLTGKTSTAPIKSGTSPPGTCGVGEYFYDTDATVGQNTYACTSTNTWTLQGDGSPSTAFSAITSGTNTTATMTVGSGATFQANNATRTAPMKSGTAPPGTCTVGDYFYDSDATVGQNTYACTSTNTWTLQGDGSGGGAGVANYETSFSAQTSVTITGATHGFAHRKILIEAYDNSTPRQRIVPSLVTVDSSTFDVVVTFAASTTGLIMLNGSGGAGTVTNAAALTLDLPVFGAGSNGIKVGTKTGTGIEGVMSQNPTVTGPIIANLAEASCDSTLRGKITVVQGGAGVGDTARICIKTDADTYIWRPIV
jgi:hypothetical protein